MRERLWIVGLPTGLCLIFVADGSAASKFAAVAILGVGVIVAEAITRRSYQGGS